MEFFAVSGDFIQLPPQNISQYCSGCSRKINLIDIETYMCARCKNYLCVECALFYHENVSQLDDNCPGDTNNSHHISLIRITRKIKEFNPSGVSIQYLKDNPKLGRTSINLKIRDVLEESEIESKKALILDDEISPEKENIKGRSKKSKVFFIDDEENS